MSQKEGLPGIYPQSVGLFLRPLGIEDLQAEKLLTVTPTQHHPTKVTQSPPTPKSPSFFLPSLGFAKKKPRKSFKKIIPKRPFFVRPIKKKKKKISQKAKAGSSNPSGPTMTPTNAVVRVRPLVALKSLLGPEASIASADLAFLVL